MVSKNQIKRITSLQQKKYRQSEQLFIAEGKKAVTELIHSHYQLEHLFSTEGDFDFVKTLQKTIVSPAEMKKITCLSTPSSCLALFKIPSEKPVKTSGLIVALDDIRDPGNLGTIIRLCDWFGVEQLVCSPETVDVYNPKVVMATMGSMARVQINYTSLEPFFATAQQPVYGTFMNGENIHSQKLPKDAIIVFGNEANGISEDIAKAITQKIAIPRFGSLQQTESLNVATATAIVLNEFRRNS